MKAGIFFTRSGAVLILTSYDSLSDAQLVEKLQAKGIDKYIAFEVPMNMVQHRYGQQYKVVMDDLKQEDDLRVLDFDGRRVFQRFGFDEMGQPTYHEA
jgi:hypothetical protein